MLTCEDCRQVVIISPAEAAELANSPKPKQQVGAPLPELLMSLSNMKQPSYVRIANKYHRWKDGSYGW